MKRMKINQWAALLLLVAGLAGCSKEETLPGTTDATRSPISITVTDKGYTSGDGSHTRATTDDNYATTFAAGDKIGIYVVNAAGETIGSNIPLTHNGTGWTGDAYWAGTGTKYFAYYPYQPDLNETVVATATAAAEFFANVVSAWTLDTDQSTDALYTAQDLMIGSGTVGTKQPDGTYPLSLTMTHAMALVVIEIPSIKYALEDDANYTWITEAPALQFYHFKPFNHSVGTYRYLVKPNQSESSELYGSYTSDNRYTHEYTVSLNNIASAHYVLNKVDGGATNVIKKTHTLQIGDYYMKNGSLLGKDVSLTNAQKAACLGVVLKVGRDIDGNLKDDCDYKQKDGTTPMNTIHGYVLALYDANNGSDCVWGLSDTNVGTKKESHIGFYGYTNTNTIKAFATKNGDNLQTAFPATYHATESYELSHPAPANSSGWFLPSSGQCWYWCFSKDVDVLKTSVQKASDNPDYEWQYFYWSSSESNMSGCAYAIGFDNGGNNVYSSYKYFNWCVRSVLAF